MQKSKYHRSANAAYGKYHGWWNESRNQLLLALVLHGNETRVLEASFI